MQVQQLINQYIKTLQLENTTKKGELIIPSLNYFYKTLHREQAQYQKKSATIASSQCQETSSANSKEHPHTNDVTTEDINEEGYDDEWDKDPYEEDDAAVSMKSRHEMLTKTDKDPLAQYTVVAGVIMPSALSSKPPQVTTQADFTNTNTNTDTNTDSGSGSGSRRSTVSGGWGVAVGEKWKPIELPKASPQSRQISQSHQRASSTTTGAASFKHNNASNKQLQDPKQQKQKQNQKKQQKQKQKQSTGGDLAISSPSPSPSPSPSLSPLPVSKEAFMKILKTKLTKYHAIIFPSGALTGFNMSKELPPCVAFL
mgnify:CR=1 FL=1